jgi:hypothetical protein
MIEPIRVLQQASAEADRLADPQIVHKVMDEVEFVYEYLSPEHQHLAEQVLEKLQQRLQTLQASPQP